MELEYSKVITREVRIAVVVTAVAALVALGLTSIFATPSQGPAMGISLASLVATAEVAYLAWRQRHATSSSKLIGLDWIASGVFVAATSLGLSRWVEYTLARSTAVSDFAQDYLAAYALRHGMEIFGAPLRQLGSALLQFDNLENFHPPFIALAFLPFSYLRLSSAFILWNFLSLALFSGLVVLLLQSYGLMTFRWLRLSSVLLLWEPFTGNTFLGQLSLALAIMIIASFFLLRCGKEILAGTLLGLTALVKLYPGLMLLYLASQWRWRAAAAFVATCFCGSLALALTIGPGGLWVYIHEVIPGQTAVFANYPLNQSLASGIKTFFEATLFSLPPFPAPAAGEILAFVVNGALILALGIFSYAHCGARHGDDLYAQFCIVMLLASPITWHHSCILLVFPMALLAKSLALESSASTTPLLLTLILFGVPNQDVIDGLLTLTTDNRLPWYVILSTRTGLIGLLMLHWIFWRRLAKSAGHATARGLLRSLGLRLVNRPAHQ